MRKFAPLILAVFFISSIANGQTTVWEADNAHSEIGFSAKHMVIATVNGKFKDYALTVKSDKEDFSDAAVDLEVKITSVDTDNERRDTHLKSGDFFEAEKYPVMTFKSDKVTKVGGDKYKITGNLTIKDVTKTVVLDGELGGTIDDPWGNTRAGITISGEINRFDYGVKWDSKLDTGSLVVGETVKINCAVELIKKKQDN